MDDIISPSEVAQVLESIRNSSSSDAAEKLLVVQNLLKYSEVQCVLYMKWGLLTNSEDLLL